MKCKYIILLFVLTFCLYADETDSSIDIGSQATSCTNCFPPIANAGEPKTYFMGSTVTLDGLSSFDPEGAELTYHWLSVDHEVNLEDPTHSNPSFSTPSDLIEDKDYIFGLIVNDGDYDSEVAYVIITIETNNTSPIIALDFHFCSHDSDINCGIDSTCDVEGECNEEDLCSNDEDIGCTEDAECFVLGTCINENSTYSVNKNDQFIIDASASYDNTLHSDEMIFNWGGDDIDEFTLLTQSNSLTLIAPDLVNNQSFDLELTLSDEQGAFDEIDIIVDVIANIIPLANLGDNRIVGREVVFRMDGRGSYDPDGVDFVCSDDLLGLSCVDLNDCTNVDCIDNPNILEFVCDDDMQTECIENDDSSCVDPENPNQEVECVENVESFCSENIARPCYEYADCQLPDSEQFCENELITDQAECIAEECGVDDDVHSCEWTGGYGTCIENPYIIHKVCSDDLDAACNLQSDCTSVLCIDKLDYQWTADNFTVVNVCSNNINIVCEGDSDCDGGTCMIGSLTDAEVSLRAPYDTSDDYEVSLKKWDTYKNKFPLISSKSQFDFKTGKVNS